MENVDLENKIPANKTFAEVQMQINRFQKGYPFAQIEAPCTIEKGIFLLNKERLSHLESYFDEIKKNVDIVKFIPASGAASRMFKSLFAYLNEGLKDENCEVFFNNLSKFPFYQLLNDTIVQKTGKSIDQLDVKTILSFLLTENGLNYGNNPKATIPFHNQQNNQKTTPVEDHIYEAVKVVDEKTRIHFTVSQEHKEKIKSISDKLLKTLKSNIEIDYSFQKKSTDTLAVTTDNEPFILENGEMLFRPGGHGALIENLNEINADFIYIKNIDNILSNKNQQETVKYKKALLGLLIEVKNTLAVYYFNFEKGNFDYKKQCIEYLNKQFAIDINKDIKNDDLLIMLKRPLRICGMVKNEGEPGGGPFWVKNSIFPQIIEKDQIDTLNNSQKSILNQSTHFNPVDLYCSIKDYHGNKYQLTDYIDNEAGFISQKSYDGRTLKALELPGLWNGAMAHWLTLFVEVPLSTFSPVKTINDILKKEHQS